MSRRPADWSPLTDSDPVPGDPDEIERAGRSLNDVADEITRQAANLRRLSTAEGWDADAGRTFAESSGELAGQLEQARGRYATAGGALKGYAPELRYAQSVADTALADAQQAQATIDANQPPTQLPAEPTPEQQTDERNRQNAHDGGISALQAARRRLTDATDHRDENAGRATRAIRDSINNDGLKDSRWDKFKNWVSENADLLRAIAKIAEIIAIVLSVIALVLAFTPLAPLAPFLLGVAALASAVALVSTILLALAGEASWIDVGLALLSVVVVGKAIRLAKRFLPRRIKGINPQKQAGHVKGTPQYNNRIRGGKPTSYFPDRQTAERLVREAWRRGRPVPGRPNVREYDFGRPVGTGPRGGNQTRVRVHMDEEGIIHGHPSGPESP